MFQWKKRAAQAVLAMMAVILACWTGGCKTPSFGNEISVQQEQQIGTAESSQIESQFNVVQVKDEPGDVADIAAKIVERAQPLRPDARLVVRVLNTEDEDAFSIAGGRIYLDTGLISRLGGDREMIAALIAHEAAHVILKHSVRRLSDAYGKAALVDLLTQGGYQEAGGIAADLDLANHNRGDEYDADRLGIRLAASAGFDPSGMLRVIKTLSNAEPALQTSEWLNTHPVTETRIKRLERDLRDLDAGKQ